MQPRGRFPLLVMISLAAAGWLAAPVLAADENSQSDPRQEAAMKAALSALNERLAFANSMYSLDASQAKALRNWAEPQLPEQIAYMDEQAVTLRRRTQALSFMVQKLDNVTEEVRQRIIDRMQGQVYQIHARAPLSLANVVHQAESALTPEAVQKGRQAIARKYAAKLNGEALAIADVDRLIIPPIEYDPTTPEVFSSSPTPKQANPPASQDVVKPPKVAADSTKTAVETPTTPPPPPARVKQHFKSPKLLAPAPPLEEWEATVHDAAKRYGFDEAQSQSAMSACKNCKQRAKDYKASNQDAYSKAEQITDDAEKRRTLKSLNERVDKLYDELKSRINAIATIEQRNRADAEEHPAKSAGGSHTGS